MIDLEKLAAEVAEIAMLKRQLVETQAGYRALDGNWEFIHSAAMVPIRKALGLPDGTVPEIIDAIDSLKKQIVFEQQQALEWQQKFDAMRKSYYDQCRKKP